jgi:hypothetical protein
MLLLRPKSQSVVNVPLGFIAIFAALVVVLAVVPSVRESTEMLASIGVFLLISLIMIVLDLRVTARKADELRVRWSFGGRQGLAQDFVLRAKITGSRSPSLRVELLHHIAAEFEQGTLVTGEGFEQGSLPEEAFEQGTLVAVLSASSDGRVKAEAIAKLLDVPLTGDLSQLGGK